MPTISHEAHEALKALADLPWIETGTRQADGTWQVSPAIAELLDCRRLAGETASDVIIRLVAYRQTGGRYM